MRPVSSKVLRMLLAAMCGAMTLAALTGTAWATPSEEPFELLSGSFHLVPSTFTAGTAEDLTTSFDFAHKATGETYNDVRETIVELPAGYDASNTAVPTCSYAQLDGSRPGTASGSQCPPASQIGVISFNQMFGTHSIKTSWPLYNVEVSNNGVTALLGFKTILFTQTIAISVRPGDMGLTATASGIPEKTEIRNVSVTVWGVPASPAHDAERGLECSVVSPTETEPECLGGGEALSYSELKPFLSTPTDCEPKVATMRADSWEHPSDWSQASTEIPPVGECERLPFASSIEVQPSTRAVESPTGMEVSLSVPQNWQTPEVLETSAMKDATVTLPQGFTVNPSAGSGLGACSPQQYAEETYEYVPGSGCPPESKIGSIEIETPLLAEKLPGSIYVATPYDNPFGEPGHPGGSLLALYVIARDPQRGILLKVAGKIEPDPVTGQLRTTFEDNPQQPFSRFTLKFRPGATAPLVSPPTCGTYTTEAALVPWSAPLEPRLVSSAFTIEEGLQGKPCPPGAAPPFAPTVISGTQNNAAGSYSPFYLRIERNDGEQEITKFTSVFAPGLTGNLTGIPFCSDAQIEAARVATGKQELEHPSCPAASEIGHTIVEAGVGTVLAQTPGKIYLAGPYRGSNLSIVSVTSATVGPFDLGTVVVRFGLRINPTTAQVEVDGSASDPIPHILDGIVVHVRDIRVYIDRKDFMANPTSCDSMKISETITGDGANPASTADDVPVTASAPFQAADCANLAFKPTFKATTSGRTSRQKGASLHVILTYPKAQQGTQADIRSVKVNLPKQLPARLTTLQKACTERQFEANPAGCPEASRVGTAKAITPILPEPLTGPAYFVSHGGAKFPELVIVLQGYGFTIDLHGETFIDGKTGVTSSTFRTVPDEPVSSFELTLPEGPESALAANTNLCAAALTMPTAFTAQNGDGLKQNTPVEVSGCPYTLTVAKQKPKQGRVALTVTVPQAGGLVAQGRGVTRATARASARRTLVLQLKERRAGRLNTTIVLRFTPTGGRQRKILRKTLHVEFP